MKNQVYSLCKRHIFKKSVCLILIFAVTLSNYTNIYPGSQVEAASQGLAQFEELKIDDNKSWFTSNAQEGGIGTFKSLNGKETYKLFTNMSGYSYNAGDLLSVKYDGVIELADEEFMLHGDNGNVYLEKIVSYHRGYITMELPEDTGGAFTYVDPELIRIMGTVRDVKAGDVFTIGGIEIHKAGTLPSWDDGKGSYPEYDPYVEPRGISVTYYDDIYSRGFTWSTNEKVSNGSLYIIEKTGDINETNIDWSKGNKISASVVQRTDVKKNKWNIYKAHVTGLKPGATYYYIVGSSAGGYSKVGTVKIEKKESDIDEVTFLHLTDSQESAKTSYDRWADVLRAGKNKYPKSSFVAFSGDFTNYSYSNVNMNEWIWGFDTAAGTLRNMPIAPSSGNHDGFDYAFVDRFDINWADYIKDSDNDILSGGNYYYTYGKNVVFINLNTNINVYLPDSEAQLTWLREVLNKYKDYKWKVVQLHTGLMSTGSHSNNYDVEYYRDKLCPIFSKYKVDLVLQGHDHVYTRSASYPFWTDARDDESEYDYKAYEKAGQVTQSYNFDGETRLWNLEHEGTHYVTINYCANKGYDPISESERDSRIHIGINPIKGNGCDSQPNLPMYGVVRIKGGILCYDSFTYDPETGVSTLYDTFSVDKGAPEKDKEEYKDKEESTEEKQDTDKDKDSTEEKKDTEEDKTPCDKDKNSTEEKKDTTTDKTTDKSTENSTDDTTKSSTGDELSKNQVIEDKETKGSYKITKLVKNNGKIVGGNVTYMGPADRNCRKAAIKAEVKLNNITLKVTAINDSAFKNCKNLKSVTIGSNVTKIGKKAFYGCKKLKTIKIKSTKIKTIGKKAFYKINKKAKFSLPKKGKTKLKRLLKKSKLK